MDDKSTVTYDGTWTQPVETRTEGATQGDNTMWVGSVQEWEPVIQHELQEPEPTPQG